MHAALVQYDASTTFMCWERNWSLTGALFRRTSTAVARVWFGEVSSRPQLLPHIGAVFSGVKPMAHTPAHTVLINRKQNIYGGG